MHAHEPQMGNCCSAPDAVDADAAARAKREGSKRAASAHQHHHHHHGEKTGSGTNGAAKSKVPDFGFSEYWDVLKLLGTGDKLHIHYN